MRKYWLMLLVLVLVVAGVVGWYMLTHGRDHTVYYHPPARTKTSGCVIVHALPDSACTPGAVDTSATWERLCTRSTREVRRTKESIVRAVFASYGVSREDGVPRENDHVISLELGGAENDPANFFPQAYEDEAKLEAGLLSDDELGAHAKDKVENWLHARVCRRELVLADAQRMIATDWVAVYHEYVARHGQRPSRRR